MMFSQWFLVLNCVWFLFAYPALATQALPSKGQRARVCISQLADHPALNATRQGIEEALGKAGYVKGDTLDLWIESAQASPALAQQIADKFLALEPDLVVAIATVSAQSFAKAAKNRKVKLVFSSVTDPLSANLVNSFDRPGRNTSGVSNFVPLEPQLELFRKILPNLKQLGILYNPGEANSRILVQKLEALTPKYGIELVRQTVAKTADVPQATQRLLGRADAIFVTNDNTALSAIANVIQLAARERKPVFVSDTDIVAQGALAALGPNQYQLGLQAGRMIVRLLQGENIEDQKVEFPDTKEIYLNLAAAAKIGIQFPSDLLTQATKVYPDGE